MAGAKAKKPTAANAITVANIFTIKCRADTQKGDGRLWRERRFSPSGSGLLVHAQ